jgi:hypothetical protein
VLEPLLELLDGHPEQRCIPLQGCLLDVQSHGLSLVSGLARLAHDE